MNTKTPNVIPEISIALCTYNRAKFLDMTLNSLIRQQTDGIAFEIVVIDDGSTDGTFAVIEELRLATPVPIRYFHQTNAGVGGARNRAVAEANAPWVAFIDDDEVASERWLRELYDTAIRSGADCVGGPALMKLTGPSAIEPVGTIRMLLGENPTMMESAQRLSLVDRLRYRATRLAIPGGGNSLVRKQLFHELGGFAPTNYGEDLDFFRRAEGRGVRLGCAAQASVYHMTPPERLEPKRLYLLARRAGASQAVIDRKSGALVRLGMVIALRSLHALIVTFPTLCVYTIRRKRSLMVSKICSMYFAMAYVRTCVRSWSPRVTRADPAGGDIA
ncbi:MAG: glycosyltransferase [Acidobacteriaceae bacterium]